jgi:hypothetical protein
MSTDSQTVDYATLRSSEEFAELAACSRSLRNRDPIDLETRDDRLAFWINVYNALVLHALIEFQIRGNLLDHRWIFRSARYAVGPYLLSLDDIEHGILRGNKSTPFVPSKTFAASDLRRALAITDPDPRIHFALHCGAKSCPPVAAYAPQNIDDQLDSAAQAFLESGGMVVEPAAGVLKLSTLFKWYRADFDRVGGLTEFLAKYVPDEEADFLRSETDFRVEWLAYDWSVVA